STVLQCGLAQALEFQNKSGFMKGSRRMSAGFIVSTRAAIRYIAIRATGSSRTLGTKPELTWGAGPGARTHGTSITTAIRKYILRMATFRVQRIPQAIRETSQVFSGGRWWRNRLRTK